MSRSVVIRNVLIGMFLLLISALLIFHYASLTPSKQLLGHWSIEEQQPSPDTLAHMIGRHHGYDGSLLEQYVQSIRSKLTTSFDIKEHYLHIVPTHTLSEEAFDQVPFILQKGMLSFPLMGTSPFASDRVAILSLNHRTLVLESAPVPEQGIPSVIYRLVRSATQ